MHKAWCYVGEVLCCFSKSSIKFQSHTSKKSILTEIGRFRAVTQVWIHQWLRNNEQSLKQQRRGALLFSMPSVKFQVHSGQKMADFDPNWGFPDCNSSLNSSTALKWCTKRDRVRKMCPFVFQAQPSSFKVTRDKKSPILTRIERFRTVTPVWIHQWIWGDAQSLM